MELRLATNALAGAGESNPAGRDQGHCPQSEAGGGDPDDVRGSLIRGMVCRLTSPMGASGVNTVGSGQSEWMAALMVDETRNFLTHSQVS
jgi:hypothetical protein